MSPDTLDEVKRWTGASADCSCGQTHKIDTRRVIIERGAIEEIPSLVADLGLGGRALVVSDENTHEAAGRSVEQTLADAGLAHDSVVLDDPCVPDPEALERVKERMPSATDFVVGVGSGTINDLSKLASSDTGKPYVACATAASMNGYPSPIAAVLFEGVKRTWPASPPVAVVADLDVLSRAPLPMTQAGLADLLSKSTANSDWRMSSLVVGGYYCSKPLEMLEETETRCQEMAGEIGRGEPEAMRVLIAALVLSGYSMVVAGSSCPASGGEHLISQ